MNTINDLYSDKNYQLQLDNKLNRFKRDLSQLGDYSIEVIISEYGDEISNQIFNFLILDFSERENKENLKDTLDNEGWLDEELDGDLDELTSEQEELDKEADELTSTQEDSDGKVD